MVNRRSLLLGGTALAAIVGASVYLVDLWDTRAGPDVIAWLKANAIPLATAEPGSDFKDLEPLRSVIGNARIVAMGEATHGTREFFQLKHRLIEYCVSQLGFTIIGFEAEYGTTLAVNDYVVEGKGNAGDVVAGMGFSIWDTEEVVALVDWVRAWNASHDRKVKFYGFDMQNSAASALHLLAYLARVAPELAAACERKLAPLVSKTTANDFSSMPKAAQDEILAQIAAVLAAFAGQREPWVGRTSAVEWHLARQSAVVTEQFARMSLIDAGSNAMVEGHRHRDRSMAANVRALLEAEGPDAKALLWAHNGHVRRTPEAMLAGFVELTNMGSVLHTAFGAEMVVVGFAFNQGAFRINVNTDGVYKRGTHTVGPAPADFLDAALAAAGIPIFALDLRRVPEPGPVATWMGKKPRQRSYGHSLVAIPAVPFEGGDPRRNFDVLLFVEQTTAARSNPARFPGDSPDGALHEPTNLALEGGEGIPAGWRMVHDSLYPYAVASAAERSPDGGRTVRIAREASLLPWGDGALTQSFSATRWRGQRLVFSAGLRAQAPRIGTGARLIVKAWKQQTQSLFAPPAKPLALQQSEGFVRSGGWSRHSIALDVPSDAERVEIILAVTGTAAGWFGDLKIESAAA
jgi:erythromycin esterase